MLKINILYIYVAGKNSDDAMTLHWWMHWFWVTAQIVGKSSLLSDLKTLTTNTYNYQFQRPSWRAQGSAIKSRTIL